MSRALVSVAIATAGRPSWVRRCLESLLVGDNLPHEIVIVDQSDDGATEATVAELGSDLIRYLAQWPPSLSQARNSAFAAARGEYVAFIDDDTEVPVTWIRSLEAVLEKFEFPDAVYGEVRDPGKRPVDLPVSTFAVDRPRVWTGVVHPNKLGYGCQIIVRRAVLESLGGFDERLGPGSRFPGAEDMDFNYRLLRAGFRAVTTPDVWLLHHQRRPAEELPGLFYRYNLAHSAFCAKHLRAGDLYPARFFAGQVFDDAKMFASAIRRRSLLRAKVAAWRTLATWQGLVLGLLSFGRGEHSAGSLRG